MKNKNSEKDKKELIEFCLKEGKESNTTLGCIIIFGGATLFGIVNFLAYKNYDTVIGLGAMLLCFFILAFLLVIKYLAMCPIYPQANDPIKLDYHPAFTAGTHKKAEIKKLSKRIQNHAE